MPSSDAGFPRPREDTRAIIARAQGLVADERRRAARAAAIAARYEERSAGRPAHLRSLYVRMAALHRQIAGRHHASAMLHELHAARMAAWLDGGPGATARPALVSVVAAAIGAESVSAMAHGRRPAAVVAAASDATARAACDLEFALGEGPGTEFGTEAGAGDGAGLITVGGSSLLERWPLYGPAVADLGVRAVLAAPLRLPGTCLGALCVYETVPVISEEIAAAAGRVADALTHTALLAPRQPEADEPDPWDGADQAFSLLFEEPDYQAGVHQAAGMVSARCGCGIDDAESLLRAHAFAEGQSVEQVAQGVLRGETRLC